MTSHLPVTGIRVDLLGDGLPAPTQVRGEDLRPVVALLFTPARAGTWSAHVYATNACGEAGTGLERPVLVQ